MKSFTSILSAGLISMCSLSAEFNWEDHYDFNEIPSPEGVDPQYGGLHMGEDGRLVACFHRGEIMFYDPAKKEWSLFAEGLHEPLGVYSEKEGTVLVIQRPEITRLHDTDGDGKADYYETICDDWGMSGNYHEFTFGLVKDSQGNAYIALGTASNGSGVRQEVRGEWNDAGGLTHEMFLYGGEYGQWKDRREEYKIPRMYARVPYRGCVLKITPGNRTAQVYATGLRTPNGLYMDENDQLWVSDNQGDWVGASRLNRIVEGGFHGHAASLLWDPKNPVKDAIPAKMDLEGINARRVKGAALFPQGDAGNSITQMIGTDKRFAPISKDKSSLLIGEMNHNRLIHYYKDVVNGSHQGGGCHFFINTKIGSGNNRFAYAPDGKTLYIGKTHLSWPGREGLRSATYNGKPFLMVEEFKLTKTGFEFTFNAPIKEIGTAADYAIMRYGTLYGPSYGSPKVNPLDVAISSLKAEGNKLIIDLAEAPVGDQIYDFTLPKGITSEFSDISSTRYWYTAHSVY